MPCKQAFHNTDIRGQSKAVSNATSLGIPQQRLMWTVRGTPMPCDQAVHNRDWCGQSKMLQCHVIRQSTKKTDVDSLRHSNVLQGSGVTPLTCGEIYDMDFVANFMENTIVKKSAKMINICQSYDRMCSGTVIIETRCISTMSIIMLNQLQNHTHNSKITLITLNCYNYMYTSVKFTQHVASNKNSKNEIKIAPTITEILSSARGTVFMCHSLSKLYTVSLKKFSPFNSLLTLSNLNRFSKFLHCWKAYEIWYKTNTTLSIWYTTLGN